ncbi:MAG: hypothetical protein HQK53_14965 [Oligoflexia bacterium]|nr:hypothetical protein [Oligoflexia bacterium]
MHTTSSKRANENAHSAQEGSGNDGNGGSGPDNAKRMQLVHRILIYTNVTSIILMAILAVAIIMRSAGEIQNSLETKANALSSVLADSAASRIWNYDFLSLETLVSKGIKSDEDLTYVAFLKNSGEPITKYENNYKESDKVFFKDVFHGDNKVGMVKLAFSNEKTKRIVYRESISVGILILIIQLILSFTLSFLIKNSLVPVIKQLSDFYPVLAAANFSVKNLIQTSSNLKSGSLKQLEAIDQWWKINTKIVTEIDAINQSTANALGVVDDVYKNATEGNEIMKSMVKTFDEINSGGELLQRITKNNTNDILSKTEVINQLVVKTKMLAMNASIEAAHAGIYGKGFSIVAKELTGLANMSGKTIDEINNSNQKGLDEINTVLNENLRNLQKGQEVGSNVVSLFERISQVIVQIYNNAELIRNNSQKSKDLVTQLSESIATLKILADSNLDMALRLNNDSSNVKSLTQHILDFLSMLSNLLIRTKDRKNWDGSASRPA